MPSYYPHETKPQHFSSAETADYARSNWTLAAVRQIADGDAIEAGYAARVAAHLANIAVYLRGLRPTYKIGFDASLNRATAMVSVPGKKRKQRVPGQWYVYNKNHGGEQLFIASTFDECSEWINKKKEASSHDKQGGEGWRYRV